MFKFYILVITSVALCSQTVKGLLNGVNATSGKFTYHAFLEVSGLIVCQGALITRRNVLTAGHCIDTRDVTVKTLFILVGNINVISGRRYGIISKAFHVTSDTYPGDDIGIVTLKSAVHHSRTVSIVKLPDENYNIIPGSKAVVTSAGAMKYNRNEYSDVLQKLSVEIINQTACARMLQRPAPGFALKEIHICTYAGIGNGLLDADSGAPLVQNDVIIGVHAGVIDTSKGLRGRAGTANPSRFPAFFMNVMEYQPWLKKYIRH